MREPEKFADCACPTCGSPRSQINPAWLRHRRQQAEMTLRAFAEQAGVSAAYICDIEKGRRNCLPDMRKRYEAL